VSPSYFAHLPRVGNPGDVRDNQRSKLYGAEHAWAGCSPAAELLIEKGPRVAGTGNVSIDACQAYVDDLLSRSWFQRRWGRRTISVRHKVSGSATGSYGKIHLPPWSRTEAVILHELAHNLTPTERAAHGPEFAGVYLELVRYAVGQDAYRAQRASFRAARVRVSREDVPEPSQHRVRKPRPAPRPVKVPPPPQPREVPAQRVAAAELIRQAVRAGEYGPAGSPARKAALATARRLDQPA
jgi:hypothetical protein